MTSTQRIASSPVCATASTRLDELDQLIDRAAARVVAPVHLDQLGDGQVVLHSGLLQDYPDALAQLAPAVAGSMPSTLTSPPVRVR
jgi:hypothetical protein